MYQQGVSKDPKKFRTNPGSYNDDKPGERDLELEDAYREKEALTGAHDQEKYDENEVYNYDDDNGYGD